jgi:hypothetical protein
LQEDPIDEPWRFFRQVAKGSAWSTDYLFRPRKPIASGLLARGGVMICHQYRCVFVHVPKCAGQSIERVFLDAVGLNWTTRASLLLRPNDKPELGPPRLAHLTADEYVTCKYIAPQQFASYFKFAIVRNPWDRMVSFYKYLGYYKRMNFKRFVTKYLLRQLWADKYWFVRPQCEFIYNRQDECLVDYVGRFEHLSAAMDHVGKAVGLRNFAISRSNKSTIKVQPSRSHIGDLYRYIAFGSIGRRKIVPDDYRSYYDRESILRVAELYRRDIDLFGYEFDPRARTDRRAPINK